ncbi:YhfH family protein [Marinococcus luteus]|uniref:YhfH-like protein n=1 Tax=Marinococcus luteus TaxID=1122204 RepID=A0A1H2UQ42_9BACI|nr:YhfH family protein [Marinococcus luteus]MDZ5783894.1 YhfH family protein [Marinococcus luteus]SDW58257.1 hypothetical protein SAMN05421781_1834 [Marinococcus luteus]
MRETTMEYQSEMPTMICSDCGGEMTEHQETPMIQCDHCLSKTEE